MTSDIQPRWPPCKLFHTNNTPRRAGRRVGECGVQTWLHIAFCVDVAKNPSVDTEIGDVCFCSQFENHSTYHHRVNAIWFENLMTLPVEFYRNRNAVRTQIMHLIAMNTVSQVTITHSDVTAFGKSWKLHTFNQNEIAIKVITLSHNNRVHKFKVCERCR